MGTATSKPAVALVTLAIGCAGCGGSGHSSSGPAASVTGSTGTSATGGSAPGSTASAPVAKAPGGAAFAWLHPRSAPSSWRVVRIQSGAELAYPPSWRRLKGDPGTATAALLSAGGSYLGYLNATPQQGGETLANWRTFRVQHNHEEGDRSVARLAHAEGLRFLNGHGSCVKDSYVSSTGVHYIEIACLIAGAHANTVIVGAGPSSNWAHVSGSIERAISGFRT